MGRKASPRLSLRDTDVDAIYLDCNATTPITSKVAEAMAAYPSRHMARPSSSQPQGAPALQGVADATAIGPRTGQGTGRILVKP
jgi:selenocysteine lyase/cysteine desulfurase